jgi:hypothetical protein
MKKVGGINFYGVLRATYLLQLKSPTSLIIRFCVITRELMHMLSNSCNNSLYAYGISILLKFVVFPQPRHAQIPSTGLAMAMLPQSLHE